MGKSLSGNQINAITNLFNNEDSLMPSRHCIPTIRLKQLAWTAMTKLEPQKFHENAL